MSELIRPTWPGSHRELEVHEYIIEEVSRQGFAVVGDEYYMLSRRACSVSELADAKLTIMDGVQRIAWMSNAWSFAMKRSLHTDAPMPTIADIIKIGRLVESLKNKNGVRDDFVYIRTNDNRRIDTPHPGNVIPMLEDLLKRMKGMQPLQFYKSFCEIHPFFDGNGRSGKILLNWVNGTLWEPVFPPFDLWGERIRNP